MFWIDTRRVVAGEKLREVYKRAVAGPDVAPVGDALAVLSDALSDFPTPSEGGPHGVREALEHLRLLQIFFAVDPQEDGGS